MAVSAVAQNDLAGIKFMENTDLQLSAAECDSVNIPVFLVDGVEVQDLSIIPTEDILEMEVIKDPAITRIFRPRLGGVVIITTKSKSCVTPIIENFQKALEESRKNRIPGEIMIR